MAEEIRASATGPNGEQFNVNLRERTIGISVKDLLPILVVIGAFVGGIVLAKILFLGQTRGQDMLTAIAQQLNENNAKITAGQHELRMHVETAFTKQSELVHTQTQAIEVLLQTLQRYIEEWFSEMGRRQELMNFNALHPEKALPLRGPVPSEEREPPRGR
jgi:hypothetical protein